MKSLKTHPITDSLDRMHELLKDPALNDPAIASDGSAQFQREKLQNVTRALRSLVSQSAATLVSDTALAKMNANLQAPIAELTAFVSDKNAAHLANAVGHIDQNVLSYTWAFMPKFSPPSKLEAAEIIDSLQERSRLSIEQLTNDKADLGRAIEALAESNQAQADRLAELREAHSLLKSEMAASLSSLETTFNKAQLQRDTDFSSLLASTKADLEKSKHELDAEALGVIDSLNKHKADASRIVQVVGDIGVTGSYQTIANRETGQANLWRWITIALFACGLAMAGITFFRFYHEPVNALNTAGIAVRLLYALAIAAPAFYTARESARHRTNADRARQTELELASLGPFIELMEESDKEAIRKSLIPTYFGRKVESHEIKSVVELTPKT